MKTVSIFHRPDNKEATAWAEKIRLWTSKKHPKVKIVEKNPQAVIVLGGDGTILEAANKYQAGSPIILGLNLGHVGFLAAVRKPENFLPSLQKFFRGKYITVNRMMLEAAIERRGKKIYTARSLNDVSIQNPIGMVDLEVSIEKHSTQYIHGTGILVATATGSTAYNLSAHGPIVMPNIECLVLTELLDHNIPTPSMVIEKDKTIVIKVRSFRKRGLLAVAKTGKAADVLLASDGETIFPLEIGDIIKVRRSKQSVPFAELEKNYFFKSLQEKFAFR